MFRPPSVRPSTVSTCPECGQPFKSADSPHIPLILGCSHVCCEECIRTAFCNDRQIICRECGKPSTAPSSLDVKLSNLRESFPLSEKMVEEINKLTQMKPVAESSIGFKIPKKRNNEKPSPNISLHEGACNECRDNLGLLRCFDCKEMPLFCENCWHTVHKFNTARNHKYQTLSSIAFNPMEKKPEYAKQLKEIGEKLLKKQDKVERSLKILSNPNLINEAKTSGIDTQQVRDDLNKFFIYCQNAIKRLENKVTKEFEAIALSLEHSQAKCYKELTQLHMEIVELNQELYGISTKEFLDSSVVEKLLSKSCDLLEKPDIIHTKRPVSGSKEIKLPSPKEWFNELENQLNLDFGQPGEIVLVKNNLDGDEIDNRDPAPVPLMPMSCAGDIGDAFEKTSHSSLTFSERSGYQPRQRKHSKTYSVQLPLSSSGDYSGTDYQRESLTDTENGPHSTHGVRGLYPHVARIRGPSLSQCGMTGSQRNHFDPKISVARANFGRHVRFREGWKGSVVVSCIDSPSCFYVQLDTSLTTMEKYRKFFSKASTAPPIDKNDIKIGNMYLAQCSDNEWYRVRFTQLSPNDQTIMVTQVDTGRKEVVDVSKLRQTDDIMKSATMDSEIAILCCIFDCYPVGSTWSPEDNDVFKEMLLNKLVTMVVKKVQSNKLEVDLEWNDNGNHMSIRDYLLMLKQACISSVRKENLFTIQTSDGMKYFRDNDFKPKQWVDVRLAFVFKPDEIYVKRDDPSIEKKFAQMNDEIDEFYKNNDNYKYYQISGTPHFGKRVAAQFTIDNTWYRAEIISVSTNHKKVEVFYVDFGNKEWLPLSRVRLLAKEFGRFMIQTIKCSLAGIKVVAKYNKESTNILIDTVGTELLKMVVEEIKDDHLSVILFKSTENEDLCLNLLLVEKQYARKIGDVLGMNSVYPRKSEIENSTPKIIVEKEVSINSSKTRGKDTSTEANVTASKKSHVESSSVASDGDDENSENEDNILSNEEIPQEDIAEDSSNQKPRFEVKISSFISPNRFYVTLVQQFPSIQKLVEEMTEFYRDERNCERSRPIKSIEKGVKCASYSTNDQKWYRAIVLEVKENDEVKVFFKDVAREEIVKSHNLRALESEFDKLVDGAVACHMVNIEERSEWPAQLLEALTTTLESFSSIRVAKFKEAREEGKDTYPVELFGYQVTCKGAFAPAADESTSVNDLLSKALQNDSLLELDPVSKEEHISEPKGELTETLKGGLEQICPIETVNNWLNNNIVETSEKNVQFSNILANREVPSERLSIPKSSSKSSAVTVDVKTREEKPPEGEIRSWKPAEPIDRKEFEVWTTYVDDDFCVFMQNLGKQRKLIDMISNGLQLKFENSTPLPSDLHWYPGQMCIAWFFLDKKWYRGKVLEIKNEKALVEYVDFGNTEWVEMIHLRKDVILEHFPIQCFKFPIRSDFVSVSEDGKWPVKILDFVHANILEKKCTVKLRKEEGEDFYRIEKLFLEDTEVDVFDYLSQLGYATFVTSSSVKRSKSKKSEHGTINSEKDVYNDDDDHESDSSSAIAPIDSASNIDLSELMEVPGVSTIINDPFNIPQNPQGNEVVVPAYHVPVEDLNLVTVEVIEILHLDQIVVHIVDCDNEAVNLNRKRFLEMNSELQKKGVEQLKLTSPSLGRICCTKFDDNLWYRAKIIDLCTDNDFVNILYVDYGNSSPADPAELREMKPSWFDVPMQAIRCRLMDHEGIANGKEVDLEEMLKLINNKYEATLEMDDDENWYKIKLFFK